jgi:hypothetical protein
MKPAASSERITLSFEYIFITCNRHTFHVYAAHKLSFSLYDKRPLKILHLLFNQYCICDSVLNNYKVFFLKIFLAYDRSYSFYFRKCLNL